MAHEQSEFDFGADRQSRIGRALRTSTAIARAVPLSDADKLMLICMDSLAQQIAAEVRHKAHDDANQLVGREVQAFVTALGDVSSDFARETARYLCDTIARFRQE